ncbi:MAG: response regulator [Saprospiraceae bacterium]|nr:response regulator [Saprospiraceae bacterium]
MKALIVEDIKKTSDLIKNRINAVYNQFSNIDQAYTLQKAQELIFLDNYDIVFWDVNMPGGTSFDLLKVLARENKINFENIFITGEKESEFIINALKFSAIDYLYKPVDDKDLQDAIEKAIEKKSKSKDNFQIDMLLKKLKSEDITDEDKKVAFNLIKGNTVFISLSEISYFEADGVVTNIILNDNTLLHANKNLGFYKSFLMNEENYFLISHSVLANVKEVFNFDSKSLEVTFKNKMKATVSRRRAKEFKEYMQNYSPSGSLFERIKRLFK